MRLQDKKVLTVVDEEYNDLELWYPIFRLQEEGATVHIAGPKANETYNGQAGIPATTDYAYSDIDPKDYDGILVPGGWAPDRIRRYEEVLDIIRDMDKRSEEHTSELQSRGHLVCRLLLEKKNIAYTIV